MKPFKLTVCALVTSGLISAGFAVAQDAAADAAAEPTTKPKLERPLTKSGKPRVIRLVQPWSKVQELSEDQKIELFMIHEDFKAKLKLLEADEEEKCMAVLSDAQKAQLADTLTNEKAAKKAGPVAKAAEPAAAE